MTPQPETVSDLFPSRWLAPADLRGRSVTMTVTAVAVEQLHNPRTDRPETKAILDFGRSKRLPLNQTQCHALAALAGSDHGPVRRTFAGWHGLRVTLHPAAAPYGKPAIRITKEGWALTAGPALSHNLTATENKPDLTA